MWPPGRQGETLCRSPLACQPVAAQRCSVQVLVPASQFLRSLVAARLAADVLDVPTVLIARTDAHSAQLLTADIDELDKPFCTGERTPEGFHRYRGGVEVCIQLVQPQAALLVGQRAADTLTHAGFHSARAGICALC